MRYHLDKLKFKKNLQQKGYKSISQWAEKHPLNRATLNHYFKGQGPILESYYELCDNLNADPLSLLSPLEAQSDIPDKEEIVPLLKTITTMFPQTAVGLFGSRAKGSFKKFSDWDFGLTGGEKNISPKEFLKIKNLIEDLSEDLPRSVDVIHLDEAPLWFLEELDYKPIFLAGDKQNWNFFLGVLSGIAKKQ